MRDEGEPVGDPGHDIAVATICVNPPVPKWRHIDAERPQAGNASVLVKYADPGRLLTMTGRQQPVDEPARRTNITDAAHPPRQRNRGHSRPRPARQDDDLRIEA